MTMESSKTARKKGEPTEALLSDVRTGEVWMIRINIVTLSVTIIIAIIYSLQLEQMRLATAAATDATRAAQQSAYQGCLGAQISRATLIEVQKGERDTRSATVSAVYQAMAATESERAEMQLTLGKPAIRVGRDFSVPFEIINSGKTAATDFNMKLRLVFLPRAKEDLNVTYPRGKVVIAVQPRAEPGPMHMNGGDAGVSMTVIGVDGNPLAPTDQDSRDYSAGKAKLVAYGRVTYRDIFGGSHWRNFCQPFVAFSAGFKRSGEDEKCVKYNGSDTGSALLKPSYLEPSAMPPPEITCKKPE